MALPPRVAALVQRVRDRMAAAPTVSLVRRMAGNALAGEKDALTAEEIRRLTAVALDRAREVETHAARLAELLTEGAP